MPLGADQRRRHHRRLDDRVRQRDAARLLEDRHEVGLVKAEPAVGVGHEQTEHAHGVEARPHAAIEFAAGAPAAGAHVGRRRLLGEEVARGVAERDLVVGEREVHRGSPSTRSAAMLRWISLVPA